MKNQNKNIYRALLILSFIGLNLLIVFAIGQIMTYLNTGADKSKMLNLALKSERVYKPHLIWSDTLNPSRPLEKPTQKSVAQDYLNAWYVREVALATNEFKGIDDYYTASARQKVEHLLNQNINALTRIEGTSLNHNLELEFYSADGQFISFKDVGVQEAQRIFSENNLLLQHTTTASYRVIMLLEDGFWRIRQLVRIPQQDSIIPKKQVVKKELPDPIKAINYYPQQNPWDTFGTDFQPAVIQTDFKKIKDLQFNTIRIFVGYEDFGKAEVTPEKLSKLKKLMDLADVEDLQVIVTLFDFYGDYSVIDWSSTFKHSRAVVNALKAHPALLAWDLKNEPNLDFESRDKDLVLFWLKNHLAYLKSLDPATLLTIGWSDSASASLLLDDVDLVSFHSYQDFASFKTSYEELKAQTNKPLMLQEFGLPTYSGIWNPLGADAEEQAEYYNEFLTFAKAEQLHYALWTLYDFKEIPTAVVGRLPWRKAKQKHFGLIDGNGEAKPALSIVKDIQD